MEHESVYYPKLNKEDTFKFSGIGDIMGKNDGKGEE